MCAACLSVSSLIILEKLLRGSLRTCSLNPDYDQCDESLSRALITTSQTEGPEIVQELRESLKYQQLSETSGSNRCSRGWRVQIALHNQIGEQKGVSGMLCG